MSHVELKIGTANCTTLNSVYGICCETCRRIIYVGETSRSVCAWLQEHLVDIKYGRQTAVAAHFNGECHLATDVGFLILQTMRDKSKYCRHIC